MLEVPRAEEEPAADLSPSPKASSVDTEPALDEGKQEALAKPRKAKDLLKGEHGVGRAARELTEPPSLPLPLLGICWLPARGLALVCGGEGRGLCLPTKKP
jgi:hypothetical protein